MSAQVKKVSGERKVESAFVRDLADAFLEDRLYHAVMVTALEEGVRFLKRFQRDNSFSFLFVGYRAAPLFPEKPECL